MMKKEVKCNIFKPYTLSIDDLENTPKVNLCIKKLTEELDEVYYKFITNIGYKIDKPYNIRQIEQIKEDLRSKDRFLDRIELTKYTNDGIKLELIPFLNCISNPLTEKEKQEIIEEGKKNNDNK